MYIHPHLDYGDVIFHNQRADLMEIIESNFNCTNPTCSCGTEDETSVHYFLRCPRYTAHCLVFLCKISDIIHSDITVLPDKHSFHILIYGSNVYNIKVNELIITETISFIRNTRRSH